MSYATLIPVGSSAIRAVGYDGHTLTVEFHTGRTRSPRRAVLSLCRPDAGRFQGAFYNRFIRGKYR
jgi:hypothetical protein